VHCGFSACFSSFYLFLWFDTPPKPSPPSISTQCVEIIFRLLSSFALFSRPLYCLGPLSYFRVAFVAVYLASGQNAIYLLRASFILFSFDFCLFVFLLSIFLYFLRLAFILDARVRLLAVVICVWFTFIGSSQACNFLIAAGKWVPNLRREVLISEVFIWAFGGVCKYCAPINRRGKAHSQI